MVCRSTICFDEPEIRFSYNEVATHSWSNHDRCDAHNICFPCIQRHVEVEILDDGFWNIRCPGANCRYHLLPEDVDKELSASDLTHRAKQVYAELRGQSGSSRLRNALAAAMDDGLDSWTWRECQACPRCHVLAYRSDGCSHLACRCGCHFCFVCGGPHGSMENGDGNEFRCAEYKLDTSRDYLTAWMCFKNDAHPALGDLGKAFGASLRKMLRWEKETHLLEEATQAWAHHVVRSTADALHVRRTCESLGAALWCAGADVAEQLQDCAMAQGASEGLLEYRCRPCG